MYISIAGIVMLGKAKKYQTSPDSASNNQFRLPLFVNPHHIRFTLTFTQKRWSFPNLEQLKFYVHVSWRQ